jgi:hypothetical protein
MSARIVRRKGLLFERRGDDYSEAHKAWHRVYVEVTPLDL